VPKLVSFAAFSLAFNQLFLDPTNERPWQPTCIHW